MTKINLNLENEEIYLILECLATKRNDIDEFIEEEFDEDEIIRLKNKQQLAKKISEKITNLIDEYIEKKYKIQGDK